MSSQRRLVLVVPGLLGPVTDADAVARLQPSLPALGDLLAQARPESTKDGDAHAAIFEAFGVAGPPWPVAAAARAGEADGGLSAEDPRWWLRADPVHLRVDTTHARLFGGYALALGDDEAADLLAEINAFYAEDGLALEAPAPNRWYLARPEAQDFIAETLERVAGRNVDAFPPRGDAARAWRAWLSELQMLLHRVPVNETRLQRGALPVNSVWLWGGGQCPCPTTAPRKVWSNEPVARGLARLAGAAHEAWPPADIDRAWPRGTTLAVDRGLEAPLVHGDIETWLQRLEAFARDWCEPLRRALGSRKLDQIDLVAGDGRILGVTRSRLRRLRRRGQPWTHWLASE